MSRTYPLGSLGDGCPFEIVGCEQGYRNLTVFRSNDSGTIIRGEMRISINEPFKAIGACYAISSGTVVRIGHSTKHKEPDEKKEVVEEPKKKPRGGEIDFPEGEFTIKMVADLNKVKGHTVHNFLKKYKGKFIVLREIENSGKKGKKAKVYKRI